MEKISKEDLIGSTPNEKPFPFWKVDDKGKIQIIHYDLIDLLASHGYAKVETDYGIIIVKQQKNIIRLLKGEHELTDFLVNHLKSLGETDVLETFSRGISGYLAKKKMELLPTIPYRSDRDSKDETWFYFKNVAVKVTANKIECIDYDDLLSPVWNTSIIERNYSQSEPGKSDFETFLFNLAGKDDQRFKSLKSIVGYLLHRYNDPGNKRAVILLDKILSQNGRTNGGTGKTLLLKAIGQLRNVVMMDGKNIKKGSRFHNQRVEGNTDIIFYDDVKKDFSFEDIYSMITGDIVVEKKGKQEYTIKEENAPKIAISSNYVVKGPGGGSDIRRRCEFEVADHYSADHQPIDDFKKLFFDEWNESDWHQFFSFMMECSQLYLQKGLLMAEPINLEANRLISATSPEFAEFVKTEIQFDTWIDKRAVLKGFNESYSVEDVTSHNFTKWLKEYAAQKNLEYDDKSTGGKFKFIIKTLKN